MNAWPARGVVLCLTKHLAGYERDIPVTTENIALRLRSVDNEHQVAIAVGGGDYFEVPGTQPHVVFQPIKTNESIKLEEGVEVTDPHRQAYLLYEHQGGLKVYDLDALDTKINECALLIPKEEARKKRERRSSWEAFSKSAIPSPL